eukprot:1544212-Rhodomonas_salina.4
MYRLVPIHHKLQAFDGSMGRRAQHSAEEQYKKRVLAPISRTLRDVPPTLLRLSLLSPTSFFLLTDGAGADCGGGDRRGLTESA